MRSRISRVNIVRVCIVSLMLAECVRVCDCVREGVEANKKVRFEGAYYTTHYTCVAANTQAILSMVRFFVLCARAFLCFVWVRFDTNETIECSAMQ